MIAYYITMKKIVFTGGGTAGHIYPNIALIEDLKNYEVHYIGSNGMEKQILKNFPKVVYHEISTVKFDRVHLLKNLSIPFKLYKSVREARKILRDIKPNVIFSKGGYVALPVAIASKKLNINLLTHESDLSLGLANKIIARYAKIVCTTFEQTSASRKNFIWTGQPIRHQIFEGDKSKVLAKIGYQTKPIILFVGGSLGSTKINSLLKQPSYLTDKYTIIHAVGKNNIGSFKASQNYFPFAYLDPIADFYAAADLVVSRAGSGVINELLVLKKPMLLLPLSKNASRGDQIENAKLFKEKGYAEVIYDEQLSQKTLQQCIEKMFKNIDFYKKNMQKSIKNNANSQILQLIEKFS